MEDVYADSSKVLLDAAGSGNMIYLPVDKLLEQRRGTSGSAAGRSGANAAGLNVNSGAVRRQTDDVRTRRSR